MCGLRRELEHLDDLPLVGTEEPGDVAVVAENEELVGADQPGDQVQVEQLDLKALPQTVQLLEELLREALGVVDEVQGREVERLNLLFLLLLSKKRDRDKKKFAE